MMREVILLTYRTIFHALEHFLVETAASFHGVEQLLLLQRCRLFVSYPLYAPSCTRVVPNRDSPESLNYRIYSR